jgi:hypothetical protein
MMVSTAERWPVLGGFEYCTLILNLTCTSILAAKHNSNEHKPLAFLARQCLLQEYKGHTHLRNRIKASKMPVKLEQQVSLRCNLRFDGSYDYYVGTKLQT